MATIEEAAHEILSRQGQQSQAIQPTQNIDDVASEILSSHSKMFQDSSIGSAGQPIYNIDTVEDKGSGLNLLDRAYFALGDQAGKIQKLKDRGFAIVRPGPNGDVYFGNSERDLRPIDPDGFLNDMLGEAAEFATQIPVIGASVIGSIVPQPTGPIVGAMAGAGAASTGMKGLSKLLGINQQDPIEVGTDVLIDTLSGGAGETLNQALKVAGPAITGKAMKLLKGTVEKTTPIPVEQQTKFKAIAKLFKATSGVDEDKTLNFIKYIDDGVAEKDAASPEKLLKLVDDFNKSVTTQESNLGQALGASERQLLNNSKAYKVNTKNLQESVLKSLNELGLINDDGMLISKPISGSSEQGVLLRAFEKLNPAAREVGAGRPTFDSSGKLIRQDRIPVLSINPNAEISSKELLSIRNQLNSVKDSSKSKNFQRIIGNIIHGNQDEALGTITHGIADDVMVLAQKVGDTSYLAHRKAFANYKSILDNLSRYGLNVRDNLVSIENITKGASNMANVLKREIEKFDSFHKPQGTDFLKRMEIWDTANAFKSTNPNIMRLNTVISMAGLGGLGATLNNMPGGRVGGTAAGIGAGVLVGTPLGQKLILRKILQNKSSKSSTGLVREGLKSITGKVINQRNLSQLIANQASQALKSSLNKRTDNSINNIR